MNKDDLTTILTKRPFTPFRLHFTNGATHDVTHPDNVLVSERMAALAVGDSLWFVTLSQVVEVEPLATVSA
jgi:hypothetical protein